MSVCGQTEEDSVSEEMGAPIREIYEQKAVSKVVRVLTVLAYLLSVSLAAILLSVYYVCVWKSPALPLAGDNDTEELSARRGAPKDYGHNPDPIVSYGGSNITVSEFVTQSITADVSEEFTNASGTRYPDAATGTTNEEADTDGVGTPLSSPALYNGTADDSDLVNDTGTIT